MSDTTSDPGDLTIQKMLENFVPPDGYQPGSGHHGQGQKSFTSTRNARHRGRKIKVKTTYRIEIDDEPVTLHTMVMDDGRVHCHGLPNYSFLSAIDLARAIIDTARYVVVPEDEIRAEEQDDHGSHGGHN